MSYTLRLKGKRRTSAREVVGTVTVVIDDQERYEDSVNLSTASSRLKFERRVLKRFPDIKGKDIESQLLELLRAVPADDEGPGQKLPQAGVLVGLAFRDGHEFFRDGDVPYVAIERAGHREIWPLRSQNYRQLLARMFWLAEDGAVPNQEALGSALTVLGAQSRFEGSDRTLANRVAWHEGSLWYDLSDDSWRAVRITPGEWEIVERPPLIFQRYGHQRPQVTPLRGGDPRALLRFLRPEDEDDAALWLGYVGTLFIPDIPHAIPAVYGDKGAGKSTRQGLVRQLVDPSRLGVLAPPKDLTSLIQILSHHWVCFLDNLSSLPDWLSDVLCRACTGESFSKRMLYLDDEDVIYAYRRCVGLNGINLVAHNPDLLDRSLLLRYEEIPTAERLRDKDLQDAFRAELPTILGGFLDALAKALVIRPQIQLPWLPRMADFATWGMAIAAGIGYPEAQFLRAYMENIRMQNETALAASAVAPAVLEFMAGREEWQGTPTELLRELETVADGLGIRTSSPGWPKNSQWLTKRLNEIRANLKSEGVDFDSDKHHKRQVALRRVRINSVSIGADPDVEREPGVGNCVDNRVDKRIATGATDAVSGASDQKRVDSVDSASIDSGNSVEPSPEPGGGACDAIDDRIPALRGGGSGRFQQQPQDVGTIAPDFRAKYADALLMDPADAVALWEEYGRPGTVDLELQLSRPGAGDDQLQAVRAWLDSVRLGSERPAFLPDGRLVDTASLLGQWDAVEHLPIPTRDGAIVDLEKFLAAGFPERLGEVIATLAGLSRFASYLALSHEDKLVTDFSPEDFELFARALGRPREGPVFQLHRQIIVQEDDSAVYTVQLGPGVDPILAKKEAGTIEDILRWRE